jgi:hypothetical protein
MPTLLATRRDYETFGFYDALNSSCLSEGVLAIQLDCNEVGPQFYFVAHARAVMFRSRAGFINESDAHVSASTLIC